MCVGMFLVLLDVTVVNVALPHIGTGLHASLSGLQWVVDGYAVTLAALLLAGGTLGDLRGHKRVVLAGLGLFGVASLACGVAPSIGVLVGARALQGVGAALLLPGTVAVITHAYPDRREQARALGIWAGVSSLALPAGPLLGGALVSAAGWRTVFLINLPVVIAAFAGTGRWVADSRAANTRQFDLGGTATAAITLAAVVFAVINAGTSGLSAGTIAAAVVGVLSAVTFVVIERRAVDPMLPLGLLRSPAFTGANTVAAAMNFVGIGTIFLATLYLQDIQHRSPLLAGVMLVPLFAPLAVLSPITGRLTARYGPRPPMTIGLLLGAAGSASLLLLASHSSYSDLIPALLGLGLGMGFLTAAVVAAAMRAVPADRAGLASAVNNTARQAAGALGIASFGAIAGTPTTPTQFIAGLHHVAILGAVLWLLAIPVTHTTLARTASPARDSASTTSIPAD